jgi:hypothetical protein
MTGIEGCLPSSLIFFRTSRPFYSGITRSSKIRSTSSPDKNWSASLTDVKPK